MNKKIQLMTKALFCAIFILFTSNLFAQPDIDPILRLNTEMHMSSIVSIDTDANGIYVLTGSSDKTAKLWDAKTGEHLRTYRIPIGDGQEGMVYASAISPDGSKVVIAGNTGWSWYSEMSTYVFSTHTGQMLKRIGGLTNIILDLEFSGDGTYLAAALAGSDGVHVFNMNNYRLEKSLLEHGDSVYNIEFDRSNRLATVSYDGHVRLFDSTLNLSQAKLTQVGELPYSLSFSPDGSKLAIGYNQSPVIEVLDGESLSSLYQPDITDANTTTDRLFNLTFSSDGNHLYAGGIYQSVVDHQWRQIIRRWSDAGRGGYIDIPVGSNTIMDVKSSTDGGVLFAGSEPEFGKVNRAGGIDFYHKGEVNSYRAADNTHFRLNEPGDEIGFTPLKGEALTFSVSTKRLQERTSEAPHFTDNSGPVSVSNWESTTNPMLNGNPLDFLQQFEYVYSVDINSADNRTVFGADWNIYALDDQGQTFWNTSIQSPAFAIKIAGNGQVLAAAHGDGTIRWYRMDDGELLLSLFTHPDNKRWIAWTPSGYYDASPEAEELIGWYMNNGLDAEASFYPIDRFFETYYHPNIIKEVIRSHETDEAITSRSGEQANQDFKQPPLVKFVSPEESEKASKEQVNIITEISDQGGGIDEVRLYHNGKLVSAETRGLRMVSNDNNVTREFDIRLLPGENIFKLTAFNSERIESNPEELVLNYAGAEATSELYVLAVGLNEYKNGSMNLNYGRPDAEAFVDAINSRSSTIFKSVNVTTLFDNEGTRKNLELAFNDIINKANPQDAFLFFYAGHGVMSEPEENRTEDFYIALHNVVKLYGDNTGLQKAGISAAEITELTRQIKARKQMIVLDACQSGGAVDTFAMRGATEQKAILQLARSAGLVVMASTGTEQYATEFQALGHGVFTYALLQGLNGMADGGLMDGKITVKELDSFINDQVPALTQEHRGQAQYPNSYARGQDFPIGIVSN
ncbi:MAG: caspase family protein [Balneolaceae bacterium]